MTTKPDKGAVISECGTYRYHLWRKVDQKGAKGIGRAVFIMLNPSTADAEQDDPTIRKCVGYARCWGFEWLDVVNLFGFRAKDPKDLVRRVDFEGGAVGPENDVHVTSVCREAQLVVCAWGAHGGLASRDMIVRGTLRGGGIKHHYLKLNGNGTPSHPLYLQSGLQPRLWDF